MGGLDDIVASLDGLEQSLTAELDRVRAARAALGAVESVVPSRLPTGAPVIMPKPVVVPDPPTEAGGLVCPECARWCKSALALGIHRSKTHDIKSPNTARTQARAAAKAARADAPPALGGELRLRCDSCHEHWGPEQMSRLASHIVAVHRREPHPAERTPRRAVMLAEEAG